MPDTLPDDTAAQVRARALWMRRTAFTMVHRAQLGHPGGDFSAADILATLYVGVLRFDPARPDWPDRDRFVMSKGHATGIIYAALCAAGYFPPALLDSYMQHHSRLNGHPNRRYLPGVEANTGPLGHGFPIAVGIALAGKLAGRSHRTFVLTGDGEQQEGSNWEAAMVAAHKGLTHLTLIIDRNRLQQGQGTEETSSLDPLDDKYRAFGFDVQMVDGHDVEALLRVLGAPPGDRPRCVIANTVKGKGVSFMENEARWHHGVPNDAQFAQAMAELV
ncbi:MAG: transketolase [Rhodobacteraceae bacterium]|jgi:transketolase|nr:transketolase [Paracoccaceae bacterium]